MYRPDSAAWTPVDLPPQQGSQYSQVSQLTQSQSQSQGYSQSYSQEYSQGQSQSSTAPLSVLQDDVDVLSLLKDAW
jgi:hypothetical protein